MEEDTGKSTHIGATGRIAGADYSLVDYNRAGVPLVEIVSEPDMRSAEEARAYLTELRAVLESLGVSDVRMEEGSLRCDANVSVRRRGSAELGTKVEIKNLNSVRSLYRAVRFEEERQRAALDGGNALIQETRHFDEGTGTTSSMRSKEFAFDYRYFPEPDLSPLEPSHEWVERIRASLPELPAARRARLAAAYPLDSSQTAYLAADPETAAFFEEAIALGGDPRTVANWMAGDLAALLNESRTTIGTSKATPAHLADLAKLLDRQVIGSAGAKTAIRRAFESGESIEEIVDRDGLRQVSDASALEGVIDKVIAANPGPVEQFRSGKENALNALIGPVMRETGNAANAQVVRELLQKRLAAG
jgi:aspartyl-tRNA(Asn)/glutamyl-tRNA(Gln) amidotransferase subunit B